MKKFLISVDVEGDAPPYLKDSYKGIEEGLPPLLDLLRSMSIKADFFTTAEVCEKYPKIIKGIYEDGHEIGCHGLNHKLLCFKTYKRQFSEIKKATEIIGKLTGQTPKTFRAPYFSVNTRTIKVLEKLEYEIDSSVLPNNAIKRFKRLFTCHSFVGAPRTPYHPSHTNVIEKGSSSILEVPITENPIIKSAPIGAGFLNYRGVNKTIDTISQINQDYIIFLIHPWELVDLGNYYPKLELWIKNICSSDLKKFQDLFEHIGKNYKISNLNELAEDYS